MMLTSQSVQNLAVAERVQVLAADSGGYLVKLLRGDRAGFLCSLEAVCCFEAVADAQREVSAARPGLSWWSCSSPGGVVLEGGPLRAVIV